MKIALGQLGTALALMLSGAGCSEAEPTPTDVASLDLRGTRIDGSDDRDATQSQPAPELEVAIEEIPAAAASTIPTDVEADLEDVTVGTEVTDALDDEASGGEVEAVLEDVTVGTEVIDSLDVEAEPAQAEDAVVAPERDENAELGTLRVDGVRELTFKDLSLEGVDYELLIDSLLFPEEYEEDGVDLPANIAALSGQKVELQGYMIPGKIARGGNVRDFMLVRDLLACCFGGIPKPDEWIDVVMAEDAEAEYIRYMPLVVTGTLTVGEDMDVDAFNPAVFKLVGIEVRRRE